MNIRQWQRQGHIFPTRTVAANFLPTIPTGEEKARVHLVTLGRCARVVGFGRRFPRPFDNPLVWNWYSPRPLVYEMVLFARVCRLVEWPINCQWGEVETNSPRQRLGLGLAIGTLFLARCESETELLGSVVFFLDRIAIGEWKNSVVITRHSRIAE